MKRKRAFMSADWALRTIAPMAFEFWADVVPATRDEVLAWAKKLRDAAPIVDKASAEACRVVASEAQAYAPTAAAVVAAYAAYDAADAASAAAAAAAAYAAASAASAAYVADADADVYAAYAAYAAVFDADVYAKTVAFPRFMWDASLIHLDALIRVTEIA